MSVIISTSEQVDEELLREVCIYLYRVESSSSVITLTFAPGFKVILDTVDNGELILTKNGIKVGWTQDLLEMLYLFLKSHPLIKSEEDVSTLYIEKIAPWVSPPVEIKIEEATVGYVGVYKQNGSHYLAIVNKDNQLLPITSFNSKDTLKEAVEDVAAFSQIMLQVISTVEASWDNLTHGE